MVELLYRQHDFYKQQRADGKVVNPAMAPTISMAVRPLGETCIAHH